MTIQVNYVTSSKFKREEIAALESGSTLSDGRPIGSAFTFNVLSLSIKENLEIDIATMVMAEVSNAYSQLKVPCIVEHAGLIFGHHEKKGYPGGLTKPMWDCLGMDFVAETNSAGQRAIARACVAYCDGKSVTTFTAETRGVIADSPRGDREFYWDTVFIPDDPSGAMEGLTYAEIVMTHGLEEKMRLSQSGDALRAFMEYRLEHIPSLWQT